MQPEALAASSVEDVSNVAAALQYLRTYARAGNIVASLIYLALLSTIFLHLLLASELEHASTVADANSDIATRLETFGVLLPLLAFVTIQVLLVGFMLRGSLFFYALAAVGSAAVFALFVTDSRDLFALIDELTVMGAPISDAGTDWLLYLLCCAIAGAALVGNAVGLAYAWRLHRLTQRGDAWCRHVIGVRRRATTIRHLIRTLIDTRKASRFATAGVLYYATSILLLACFVFVVCLWPQYFVAIFFNGYPAWPSLVGAGLAVIVWVASSVRVPRRTANAVGLAGPPTLQALIGICGGALPVCLLAGWQIFLRRARLATQLNAIESQQRDLRQPILLLRSFQDDETPIRPTSWYRYMFFGVNLSLTLEELIVSLMRSDGPVVAIGKPGERSVPIGAARSYHADDQWRDVVATLLARAQRVVVILGPTENIAWEFAKARELEVVDKLVVVFPPVAQSELETRWERFSAVFPEFAGTLPRDRRRRPVAAWVAPGSIRYFTCDRSNEDAYRLCLLAAEFTARNTQPEA